MTGKDQDCTIAPLWSANTSLSPVVQGHAGFLNAFFKDPEVMAFSEGLRDDSAVARWIDDAQDSFCTPGGGAWLISESSEANYLGYVSLMPADLGWGKELWLGCRLLPAAWGKGIAAEACSLVLERAFTLCGTKSIAATLDPLNLPSRRLAHRLGFQEEGSYFPPAYDHPDGVYRIKKEQWHG